MRAEIGLADLLRAWDTLGRNPVRGYDPALGQRPAPVRDPAMLAALTQALGLSGRPSAATRPIVGPVDPPRPPPPESPRPPPPPVSTAEKANPETGSGALALDPMPPIAPPAPAWLSGQALDRAAASPRAPAAPLFVPERERALLAAIARRPRAEGEIDAPALIALLARRLLPRALPRRWVPSLRGGVQLILDQSPFMAPFAEDVERLVARMRAVVGAAAGVLWVTELPPLVLASGAEEPRRWAAPPLRTAVVIVSDLGRAARRRGRRTPGAAWHDLLREMTEAGLNPVVLAPGRAASYRADGPLPRRALLLGWDRAARLAEITNFYGGRR